MSTSLLVSRMEKVARENGENHYIWAAPADSVRHHIKKADVILLGPQIRFMLPDIKKLGDERGIPVDIISMVDYGTYNGGAVLEHAIRLVAKEKG